MLLKSAELFGTPTHLIMDPIHGGIPFFRHEQKILNHPLFQRLRCIKQNDILHFVFPGATHTRLEHCIGTMHVAARIFKNMVRKYISDSGDSIELSKEGIEAIQYCYGCLRLAALLHDVGHLPFSHQFEEADAGRNLLKNKEIVSALWPEDLVALIGSRPDTLHHEHYSIRVAYEILSEIDKSTEFQFETNDIIGMMEGGVPSPSDQFCKKAVCILNIFSRVPEMVSYYTPSFVGLKLRDLYKDIISGEIDADKMDYLLRDSYFSGCNYGAYNIDHLVRNVSIGFDMTDSSSPWIGLAINKKGIGALEDFVHSRFRMYLQVYGHKTVVGLKWLVRQAVAEILNNGKYKSYIVDALTKIDVFSTFTDTYCWEAFRSYAKKHKQSACADIINRNTLYHVDQIDDQVDFEKNRHRSELEKDLGYKILQHECSSRFSKINPSFAKMRVLIKHPVTGLFYLGAITKSSSFFNNFHDVIVTHYYRSPEWLNP